jgi:hypothetical protein
MEEEDVFIRHPPARIRYDGDQPVALLGVRVASSYRLAGMACSLGLATLLARNQPCESTRPRALAGHAPTLTASPQHPPAGRTTEASRGGKTT